MGETWRRGDGRVVVAGVVAREVCSALSHLARPCAVRYALRSDNRICTWHVCGEIFEYGVVLRSVDTYVAYLGWD